MSEPSVSSPTHTAPRPPMGPHAENDAASQADRVAAETLIRTTVQSVGNGSVPQDLDDLVRRNAGRVTREDLRAGRLDSSVLGDIINSVEQAKGNSAINWHAATPQQIKAYLAAHGLSALGAQRLLGSGSQAGEGASRDAKGAEGQSGARFGEISKAAMEARDIALSHGMSWAADNRELLKMGPAAMQALADVHLRQDSYQRFKDVGLSNQSIVAGARYAKRNGIDYNQVSRDVNDTHKQLTPEQQRLHVRALDELYKAPDGQAGQEVAKKRFNGRMEQLKKENPAAAPTIEKEQRSLGTINKKIEAEAKVADAKVNQAQQSQAKMKATRSKLLASLD